VRSYNETLRLNPNYTLARNNLKRALRQRDAAAGPSRTNLKP